MTALGTAERLAELAKFFDLRRKAQTRPQFDMRRFHEAILAQGVLPARPKPLR